MKCYFTLALALLAATTGSAYAENPYAPTGNETVIGQTQILYHPTKDKLNTLSGAALGAPEGWSMQCMNETKNLEQAGSITIDGTAYPTIKISNGAQSTITLPEGLVVNAVTIYSVINKDAATARPCFWKEVDGTTYETPASDYLTSFKNFENPDVSYFKLKGESNSFTLTNGGEQPLVVLVVDYSEKKTDPQPVDPGFGEGALAVSNVWPGNENTMLPLNGEFVLTFPADVTVAGKADLNGAALDMTAETTTIKIPYTNLAAATEYTLTIPAKTIGNSEAANEVITYTFTTRPANVLFYSDFNLYPFAYYEKYGLPFITDNVNILAKGSTNKTAEAAGMTFFSGTSGRVVALKGNVCSDDATVDYGPNTEADNGASARAVQLIDGGNGLYVEFPEIEGPADVTFFIANAKTTAGTIVLTDELGDTKAPLASFELPAAKKMSKYTYTYPYKGTVKLRLYNMKNQINVNDVMIVKGEGEGIDKPVIKDEEAPVLVKSWPSAAAYAPVAGSIVLHYSEPVVITGKAIVNGVETDVVVDGNKATIAYSDLENGKAYTVNIPAVADEAGNELPASEMTINTAAAEVLYYTDYGFYPYAYWDLYNMYPADGVDNGDILAKNSSDKEAQIAGIKYVVGATAGRVVAMGKSNLLDDPDGVNATERCAQISGGGADGLYLELPEVLGPCKLTLKIGNSTAKAFDFTLRNAADSENAIATFNVTADKKMFKFEHTVELENNPVRFRIYNNGNQFNLHDILVTKVNGGTVGVEAVAAEADVPAVYYNLQGAHVENPAEGLYIRVKGNKVEKVIL